MNFWSRVKSLFGPSQEVRMDGWVNNFTGASTAVDKLMYGTFEYEILDRVTLESLYYGNDIARKIIDHIVYDSMREGYEIVGIESPEKVKEITKKADDLFVHQKVEEWLKWTRLYGGAGLLLGVQDFQPFEMPLDPEGSFDITYLRVVDKRYTHGIFWDDNIFSNNYGNPLLWLVGSYTGPTVNVHTSRFLNAKGISVDEVTKRRLNGWGFPVLQPVYDALRNIGQAEHAAVQVLVDMNLDVFKLQGLIAAVSANMQRDVEERMMHVDMRKNAGKSVLLDADKESMERLAGNVPAGVAHILDHLLYRISCAADMPVAVLFGRAPQGMNSTGDMDMRLWYDRVAAFQEQVIKPALLRILKAIAKSLNIDVEEMDIEFKPLYQMTPQEQATVEKTIADKDAVYMGEGVLTPEEVAKSRYGKGVFSMETKIDPDLPREKPLVAEVDPLTGEPIEPEPGEGEDPDGGEEQVGKKKPSPFDKEDAKLSDEEKATRKKARAVEKVRTEVDAFQQGTFGIGFQPSQAKNSDLAAQERSVRASRASAAKASGFGYAAFLHSEATREHRIASEESLTAAKHIASAHVGDRAMAASEAAHESGSGDDHTKAAYLHAIAAEQDRASAEAHRRTNENLEKSIKAYEDRIADLQASPGRLGVVDAKASEAGYRRSIEEAQDVISRNIEHIAKVERRASEHVAHAQDHQLHVGSKFSPDMGVQSSKPIEGRDASKGREMDRRIEQHIQASVEHKERAAIHRAAGKAGGEWDDSKHPRDEAGKFT